MIIRNDNNTQLSLISSQWYRPHPRLGIDQNFLYLLVEAEYYQFSVYSYNLLTGDVKLLIMRDAEECFPHSEHYPGEERNFENACFDMHACAFLTCRFILDTRPISAAHPTDEDICQFYMVSIIDGAAECECQQIDVVDTDGTLAKYGGNLRDFWIVNLSYRHFCVILDTTFALDPGDSFANCWGEPRNYLGTFHIFRLVFSSRNKQWEWSLISGKANDQLITEPCRPLATNAEDHVALLRQTLDKIADPLSYKSSVIVTTSSSSPLCTIGIVPAAHGTQNAEPNRRILLYDVSDDNGLFSIWPISPDPYAGYPLSKTITVPLTVAADWAYWIFERPTCRDDVEEEKYNSKFTNLWALDLKHWQWRLISANLSPIGAFSCIVSTETDQLYAVGFQEPMIEEEEGGGTKTHINIVQAMQIGPQPLRHLAMRTVYNTFIRPLPAEHGVPNFTLSDGPRLVEFVRRNFTLISSH